MASFLLPSRLVSSLWLASLLVVELDQVHSFQPSLPKQRNPAKNAAKKSSVLWMGLYDTPLPPRPSPQEEGSNKKDSSDEEEEEDAVAELPVTQRLFSMQDNGTEGRNLLPPLGRRLDLGIGCYFEITDRSVLSLATQANCNPLDAAWALEACKGDTTEARTCISVAQRMALESIEVELRKTEDPEADDKENDDELLLEQLEQKKQNKEAAAKADDKEIEDSGLNLDDVKSDLYDMLREEEWEEMAEKRLNERNYQKRMEAFKLSEKDAQWLPTQNPRPIDDEPWFTG